MKQKINYETNAIYDFEKEVKFFLDGYKPLIAVDVEHQNTESFIKLNESVYLRKVILGMYYFFQDEIVYAKFLKVYNTEEYPKAIDKVRFYTEEFYIQMGLLCGYPLTAVRDYNDKFLKIMLYGGYSQKLGGWTMGYMNFNGLFFICDLNNASVILRELMQLYNLTEDDLKSADIEIALLDGSPLQSHEVLKEI